jgi:hypothetical protein
MATKVQETVTPATLEVEVKRIERYACGCTSTRIHTAEVDRKWLLACPGHKAGLAQVETVMSYRTAQPEAESD